MKRVKEYYILRSISILLLFIIASVLFYTFGSVILMGVGSIDISTFLMIITTFIVAPMTLAIEMTIKGYSL